MSNEKVRHGQRGFSKKAELSNERKRERVTDWLENSTYEVKANVGKLAEKKHFGAYKLAEKYDFIDHAIQRFFLGRSFAEQDSGYEPTCEDV